MIRYGRGETKIFSGLIHKKNNTVEFDEELLAKLNAYKTCLHCHLVATEPLLETHFLFPEIPKLCRNTTTGSN